MRRKLVATLALLVGLCPTPALATSGSPGYGDPPGWCTRFSDMWTATVVTKDPLVGTNPERNTFYGFHPNPGYDDWYGYFYGDFRGSPADVSGWVKLLHENYPDHYSWNFASNGWAVHGHAKQYIAYYNWTFGGQCGLGRYGSPSPPPFMADQYGWPVVDIYVDAVPPFPPAPRVVATTPTSVTFTWDPVADRGDGAGQDYFVAGLDHYNSWITVNGGPPQQAASTSRPRMLLAHALPRQTACVHVIAVDRVGNATSDQVACAKALGSPPRPSWPAPAGAVVANPGPVGLVGLESWFWLEPRPAVIHTSEIFDGVEYRITANPTGAEWDFGDGTTASYTGPWSFGSAFPVRSSVAHVFQAHSQAGYPVRAEVTYDLSWTALVDGAWAGPYPMGTTLQPAVRLIYPVEQAQPALVQLGP